MQIVLRKLSVCEGVHAAAQLHDERPAPLVLQGSTSHRNQVKSLKKEHGAYGLKQGNKVNKVYKAILTEIHVVHSVRRKGHILKYVQ